jgi:hypothetical protein
VYLILYDDAQIEAPNTLQPSDIQGIVCEGCLTSWVKDLVGQPVTLSIDNNGNTLTLINQYGCKFPIDLLTCAEVKNCETPLTVIDTNTVNLTTSGTSQHTLQADVKISAQQGNDLQVLPDGLFVDISAICDEVRQCFSGVDTQSIQYIYNPANGQHSANVIVSPDPTNQVLILPTGLYVPPAPGQTPINPIDTATVDMVAGGPFNTNLSANVKVSSALNNCLTVNPDGLYSPCTSETPNTVIDTNTVDLTASGPFNRTIQADVKVSSAPNNCLTVNPDGLYSPCYNLSLDTGFGCTGVGPGQMLTQASIAGNVLTLRSASEHTSIGGATPFGNTPVTDRDVYFFDPVLGTGVSFSGPATQVEYIPEQFVGVPIAGYQQIPWVITNPDPCRSMLITGILEVRLTWNLNSDSPGSFVRSSFTFALSLDGAPYVNQKTYPFRNFAGEQGATGVMNRIQTYMAFQKVVPPGGNLVVRATVRVEVQNHSTFAGAGNPASTEITGSNFFGMWWGHTI